MSAPEYVPQPALRNVRSYSSPPRRPGSWRPDRPGELVGPQPRGERLGAPGPDQGYIYVLARRFDDRLHLAAGEHHADAVAGCVGIALKRASLLGRAPIIHDLAVAFTIWGYLDDSPHPDLVALRRGLFEEVSNPHHYPEQRRLADMVPDDVLRQSPQKVAEAYRQNWHSLLSID